MQKGEKIRMRALDRAAQDWGIPAGAEGVVICRYELRHRGAQPCECVDVRFEAGIVVWGAPVAAFEEIKEIA